MFYLEITTKYNVVRLLLEEDDFYNESLQEFIKQPYVANVQLNWVDDKEIINNSQYANAYKVKKKER